MKASAERHVSEEEYAAIRAISHTDVRLDQLDSVVRRIKKSGPRLQLRFPSVFRDGVILQFLSRFIVANERIRVFTCGLASNYCAGFYALRSIIAACANIKQFKLRINDLSLAAQPFFDALARCDMEALHLRFDAISDANMRCLCDALRTHRTLRHLSIGCPSLSSAAIDTLSDLLAHAKLEKLSLSMTQPLCIKHAQRLCDGIARSRSIRHLDVEDCALSDAGSMAVLVRMLGDNHRITALTVGNNGSASMRPLFQGMGALTAIEKLIVTESQFMRGSAERVDLDVLSASLSRLNRRGNLKVLQLPLFIFDDTTNASLERFVSALSTTNSAIATLSLFPLFEHLDRASDDSDPAFCAKLAHFFHLLFAGLASSRSLKKLYLEMIGSEQRFVSQATADSFLAFLRRSRVNELYVPFVRLAELNGDILSDGFAHCRQLLSVRDDSIEYQRDELVDEQDTKCLEAVHRQCRRNLSGEISKHLAVKDVADLIVNFCGTEADCTTWW